MPDPLDDDDLSAETLRAFAAHMQTGLHETFTRISEQMAENPAETSFGGIPLGTTTRGTWEQTISIPRSVLGTALSPFPEESDKAYQARHPEILRPDPILIKREKEKEKPPGPSLWARLLDLKNWI
jgi:hypothetical protein